MDYRDHKKEDRQHEQKSNLLEDSEGRITIREGLHTRPPARKSPARKSLPFSLKKIRQDEERWNEIRELSIFEFLGKPSYKNPLHIPDKEVSTALELLQRLCENKGISLVVRGYYPPKEIYRFITNELFQFKTGTILQPDCICKIIYEDYHPNHKISIEDVCSRFLNLWTGRRIREFNFELADVFVTSKGQIKTKFDVLSRIHSAFENITGISDSAFYFSQISFNWDEEENSGTGHAEGVIRYTAVMKDQSIREMEGSFKFYLTNENNSWEIFYFILPGFNW